MLVLLQVNDLELMRITDATEAPVVIHGTSKRAWETIQSEVCLANAFYRSSSNRSGP